MTHFIEDLDRQQTMLLPEHLDDYVDEHSPVRVIDAFADMLNLAVLGFNAQASAIGRPGYHPELMLRIYLYGYDAERDVCLCPAGEALVYRFTGQQDGK